jgi:hypothetical protein
MPLPASWHGDWQSKFFDLGHVPLFGALTIYLWFVLGRSWLWPPLIALVLAGLAELVQDQFGRTGNLLDFVRGALGITAALVALHFWQGPRRLAELAIHALAIVALVAWPVVDSVPLLLDAWEASRSFPTLSDFASERQMLRWRCNEQATLQRIADPKQPSGTSGQLVLRPGPDPYPAAALQFAVRDWTGKQQICCTFTVPGEPLILVFSIRARSADGRSCNFQFEKTYAVGTHTIRLDLAAVAPLAKPAPLNLTDVRRLLVFTYRSDRPRIVDLHRVWLE